MVIHIEKYVQPLVGKRSHPRECRHPSKRETIFPSAPEALVLPGDTCAAGLTRRKVHLNRILKFQQCMENTKKVWRGINIFTNYPRE